MFELTNEVVENKIDSDVLHTLADCELMLVGGGVGDVILG